MRRLTVRRLLACFVLAAVKYGCAEPPADLVITNARLFDGTGAVIDEATIVVSGDRIQAVTSGKVAVEGAQMIDATGKTVLPGLIDTHVHLLIPDGANPDSDSAFAAFLRDELPGRLQTYLESGFTTVLSTGDFWPEVLDVRARLSSGQLRGPRLLIVGPVFTAPDGHPAATVCLGRTWCRERLAMEVDDPERAREAVRRVAESGAHAIKLVYDDQVYFPGDPGVNKLRPETVQAIIEEAHAQGIPAIMHVRQADVIDALEWGVDRLVHLPAVPPDSVGAVRAVRIVETLRRLRVSASTTLGIGDRWVEMARAAGRDSVARYISIFLDAGVSAVRELAAEAPELMAIGSDAPLVPFDEALYWEIRVLRNAGLSSVQILQAATRNAAAHIGRLDDLGTVEPGKLADLIIVDGDPLEDISELHESVEIVIQGGELIVDKRQN